MGSIYRLEIPQRGEEGNRVYHIDLSKIVSVSDAGFWKDGGYLVQFRVWFQLMNESLLFKRDFLFDEEHFCYYRDYNPEWATETFEEYNQEEKRKAEEKGLEYKPGHYLVIEEEGEVLAVKRMQKIVDELIKAWEEYKNE